MQDALDVYPALKSILPVVINLELAIFCFLIPILTSRYGRKQILQFGCAVNCLATGIVAVGFTITKVNQQASIFLVIAGLIVFMGNYGQTIGAITFTLIPEIVRPHYVSYALATVWTATFLVTFLFPIISTNLFDNNPAPMFYFFTIWIGVSIIINHKYVI
jgi:SP family arabinose:H+ symporter-like MFS transporter